MIWNFKSDIRNQKSRISSLPKKLDIPLLDIRLA